MSRPRLFHAALAATVALTLLGCATPPDPEDTRDSLTEVTEDPVLPDAAVELDAKTLPEPVVDPLACTDYLIVMARGTGEPSKKQLLATTARAITREVERRNDEITAAVEAGADEDIGDASNEDAGDATGERDDEASLADQALRTVHTTDIDYPADTEVKEGATIGVRQLIDQLNVQARECVEQSFILLGYSQGALIVGDALVAPETRLVGPTVGLLSTEAEARILAIALLGNPRFVGSEPFDAGTFDPEMNGILPRPPGSFERLSDRMIDFCVENDFVCQSSLDLDPTAHQLYYHNGMATEAAEFVISRLP